MELPRVEDFHGLVTYAMVRAPGFNPEDGRDRTTTLAELRKRHLEMRPEWWGGEDLYAAMGRYLHLAESHLDRGDVIEAKRAWGEIYAIIDQTPMNTTLH